MRCRDRENNHRVKQKRVQVRNIIHVSSSVVQDLIAWKYYIYSIVVNIKRGAYFETIMTHAHRWSKIAHIPVYSILFGSNRIREFRNRRNQIYCETGALFHLNDKLRFILFNANSNSTNFLKLNNKSWWVHVRALSLFSIYLGIYEISRIKFVEVNSRHNTLFYVRNLSQTSQRWS